MQNLNNTEVELKKSVAYKKKKLTFSEDLKGKAHENQWSQVFENTNRNGLMFDGEYYDY